MRQGWRVRGEGLRGVEGVVGGRLLGQGVPFGLYNLCLEGFLLGLGDEWMRRVDKGGIGAQVPKQSWGEVAVPGQRRQLRRRKRGGFQPLRALSS